MALTAAELEVRWGVSGERDVLSSFSRIDRSVRDSTGRMSRHTSRFGSFLGTAVKRGAQVGAVALGVFSGSAIKTAADFDTTMRTMSAVAGVPGPQLEKLRQLAVRMGRDTVFSANDAAGAMLELSKAGISTKDIMGGALKNTLDLAAAGNLDLATAATIASNAMNTFGLSGQQSRQAADALAGAANASSADVADLADALAQGGQSASAARLSSQEATAALAAFADKGLRGSDAGTSLKTMLLSLVPTTDKAREMMNSLGISFTDQQGNIKSLTEIAGILQTKLGGLTQAQQQTALKTIFGTDAFRAAYIMMNQGREGMARYIDATTKVGNASRVAEARTSGLAGIWESMKGSVETVALRLGEALSPALSRVGGAVTPLINSFGAIAGEIGKALAPVLVALARAFSHIFVAIRPVLPSLADLLAAVAGLLPPVAKLIAQMLRLAIPVIQPLVRGLTVLVKTFGNVGLAVAGTLLVLPKLAGAFRGIMGVFQVVSRAFTANPWALLIGATVALVTLIITKWNTIKETLLAVWNRLKDAGAAVWEFIKKAVQGAWNFILDITGGAIGFLLSAWRGFLNFFFGIAQGILNAAATAFGWIPGIGPAVERARDRFARFTGGVIADLNDQIGRFYSWGEQSRNQLAGTTDKADKAKGSVQDLGAEVSRLPDGKTINIKAHTYGARREIEGFRAWVDRMKVGVSVEQVGLRSRFHSGGKLAGRGDIPITAEGGEMIFRTAATESIERHFPGLLEAMNKEGARALERLRGLVGTIEGVRDYHRGGKVPDVDVTVNLSQVMAATKRLVDAMKQVGGVGGAGRVGWPPVARIALSYAAWARNTFGTSGIAYNAGPNRTLNNVPGAALSQHAFGNATDQFGSMSAMRNLWEASIANRVALRIAHIISPWGSWSAFSGFGGTDPYHSGSNAHDHTDFLPQYAPPWPGHAVPPYHLGAGGIAQQPVVMGDRGREAFLPLDTPSGERQLAGALAKADRRRPQVVNVNIAGKVETPEDIARKLDWVFLTRGW